MLRVDNLYDPQMLPVLHAMQQALMAHTLKRLDVDYVVRPGEDGTEGSRDRRRAHGATDARAALVRRPAPGGRSQGRHPGPLREPDLRVDHLPELFPDVRQARGHDRHGGYRGRGVREDLRPRRVADPDEPAAAPDRRGRRRLQVEAREVRRDRPRSSRRVTRPVSPCSSARSRSRLPRCSSKKLKKVRASSTPC